MHTLHPAWQNMDLMNRYLASQWMEPALEQMEIPGARNFSIAIWRILPGKPILIIFLCPAVTGELKNPGEWQLLIFLIIFGKEFTRLEIPFLDKIGQEKIDVIVKMIRSGINCPLVSSAGRLFDAVSAMLGLTLYSTFSAEAPMRLESIIEPGCSESYPFTLAETVNFDLTITGIVEDIKKSIDPGIISAKFHNTIISVIAEVIHRMKIRYSCNKVVLSGGTFQNKYLLERTEMTLLKNGFSVYSHHLVPTNDGGVSLGQLAVAAKRKQSGLSL